MSKDLVDHLQTLKIKAEDIIPVLIGSRAFQYIQNQSTDLERADWDIIATAPSVISWLQQNDHLVTDVSFVVTKDLETSARVVMTQDTQQQTIDFVIPTNEESSLYDIFKRYLKHQDQVTTSFPGGGICRIPDINLLIAIKEAHLHYPVNWKAHIKKYHELLANEKKLSGFLRLPFGHEAILADIKMKMIEEGKKIHKDKQIASLLPPFSKQDDITQLANLQLQKSALIHLLLPKKDIFSTLDSALEWACVTGSPRVSNFIISNFFDIFESGSELWKEGKDDFDQQLQTILVQQCQLAKETRNLPQLTFGNISLPSELHTYIFSMVEIYRNLSACECLNKEWRNFFQHKQVWHNLYINRWSPFTNEVGDADWKKFYKVRCARNIILSATALSATNNLRTIKGSEIMELADALANCANNSNDYQLFYSFAGMPKTEEDNVRVPPLNDLLKKELRIYANKLEKSLQTGIISHVSADEFNVPSSSTLKMTLYDLTPNLDGKEFVITCCSGNRGNSRHSYFCVEITLEVAGMRVLRFDRPQLQNRQFSKYSFVADSNDLLSTKLIECTGLPSRLLVALCIAAFPAQFKKQLIGHFNHGLHYLEHSLCCSKI